MLIPVSYTHLDVSKRQSSDNNKLSGTVDAKYFNSLINDKAAPMINRATQSFTAPGSTYKPCTTIAGMDTGTISSGTTFYCSGSFDKVTPAPKCWSCLLYTSIFKTEDALVRPQIICGTHALNVAISSNLRPGDELLSPVGKMCIRDRAYRGYTCQSKGV